MELPWNPPTRVVALFNQLENAGALLSDTCVVIITSIGYNIINTTVQFEIPCRDWRQKVQAAKTRMTTLQEHFRCADLVGAPTLSIVFPPPQQEPSTG
jgi:hypothetical protein